MSCQYFFNAKALEAVHTKPLFIFMLRFIMHESTKVFDVTIMGITFILYKQLFHGIFKILFDK